MRRTIGTLALLGMASVSWGQAKDCEELKAEIDAKVRANGASAFTLAIVDKDAPENDGKVVGTCGGGTKKIIYHRGAPPAGVESGTGN